MTNHRFVARSKAIAARPLGDETMIMSAVNSTLYTLNEIASVIWDSADGVTPLDEIVANKICAQYEVAPEVALRDAEAIVDDMAGHGILIVSNEPMARSANSSGGAR